MSCAKNGVISELMESVLRNLWENILHHYCVKCACVCVCIYIYVCVCVYIYMCVCVCVCVCIYICVYICIYICAYTHTHTHTLIERTNGMYVCMCVCVCVYIYIGRERETKLRAGRSGVRIPTGDTNFSPLRIVHTVSGSLHASYPMVHESSFTGVKRPRHEADHLPPSITEIKNYRSSTSIPPVHLPGLCRENFPFINRDI